MALVAYDYGSESENEDEEEGGDEHQVTSSSVITPIKADKPEEVPFEEEEPSSSSAGDSEAPNSLSLPLPKSKAEITGVAEDTIEDFIPKWQPVMMKKPKEKVKITIPSLSQFEGDDDDDDEPDAKKPKTTASAKGSGLLAILPPIKSTPITTKSFVPNVLKNKPAAFAKVTSTTTSLVPDTLRRKAAAAAAKKSTTPQKPTSSSDLESDDEIELPETFDEDMWLKVCGKQVKSKPKPDIIQESEAGPSESYVALNIAPEPERPYDGLDNEAFQKLVGKNKRPQNIKLVDIHEADVLEDKDLWLAKSLTDPDSAPKPAVDNPVDPTRRKKHHITYLAEQAKANEQELQAQWASSRYNKNQTRAKYGF